MGSNKGITKLKLIIILFILFLVIYGIFLVYKKNENENDNKIKEENKIVYVEKSLNTPIYEYDGDIETDLDKNKIVNTTNIPTIIPEGQFEIVESNINEDSSQIDVNNIVKNFNN